MVDKDITVTGVKEFLEATDEFHTYLAGVIRDEMQGRHDANLERLHQLSELIKVNKETIKITMPKGKSESSKKSLSSETPIEKTKRKANGDQVVV